MSLIVGTTMAVLHVVPTFFSLLHLQFSFLPSGTLDKIDRRCHKIHTLSRDMVTVSDSSRGAHGCALAPSPSSSNACKHILMFALTYICTEYNTTSSNAGPSSNNRVSPFRTLFFFFLSCLIYSVLLFHDYRGSPQPPSVYVSYIILRIMILQKTVEYLGVFNI